MIRSIRFIFCILSAIALTAGVTPSIAQNSEASIRIVVPYSPGGGTDILARMVAQRLQERIKRSVVVENINGGGGVIGTAVVARAKPDGTTLLFHTGAITLYPALKRNTSFDVVQDLRPITTGMEGPLFLMVNQNSSIKNMSELITQAKANPGAINYGSAGVGTTMHLAGELLGVSAGIKMTHVPYRGESDANVALLGGQIQFMIEPVAASMPLVHDGKLRPLAVSSAKRSEFMPDLPTIAELGVPGYDVNLLYFFLAPSKTPEPVVKKLNEDLAAILTSPDMANRIKDMGLVPIADTLEQVKVRFDSEIQKWKTVAEAAGIHVE
jgi:tripartite-type tricarboxylate transporter receptor subunit TctC